MGGWCVGGGGGGGCYVGGGLVVLGGGGVGVLECWCVRGGGQARMQGGGGQGCLAPPPFSGEKTRGPKTTHTEEKKIKIGQPRSKIQAKTYHKTH